MRESQKSAKKTFGILCENLETHENHKISLQNNEHH